MRIYNPQNQLGENLLTVEQIKPLVKSYLNLSETLADVETCQAAATIVKSLLTWD